MSSQNPLPRRIVLLAAVLLLAACGSPGIPEHLKHPSPPNAVEEVVRLINEERAAHGLKPLKPDPQLMAAAAFHAEYMAKNDCYAHNCRGGPTKRERIRQSGYPADASENIHAAQRMPRNVVTDWMNSPGHRKNILAAQDTEIGVGHYYLAPDGGRAPYYHYWVANFAIGGTPAAPVAAPAVAPAAAPVDPAERVPEFIRLVNAGRAERGLGPLAVDPHLSAAARSHVEHMAKNGCLECPDSPSIPERVRRSGYTFGGVASVTLTGYDRPADALRFWMQTSGPSLAPLYTRVGVAYVHLGQDHWLIILGKPVKT